MDQDDAVREPSPDDAAPSKRRRPAWLIAAIVALALIAAVALAIAAPWRDRSTGPSPSPSASGLPGASTSASLAPTAAPPPSPSATEPAVVVGTVTKHPNLPLAKPLERGLLARAGEGWSLVQYSATQSEDPFTAGPQILYLVSPDGTVYQAHDFGATAHVRLVDWAPGTSLALVLTDLDTTRDGFGAVQTIDLETGATVGSFALAPGYGTSSASFTRPTGQNVVVSASAGSHGWLKRFSRDGHELATLLSDTDPDLPAGGVISFDPVWLYGQDGTFAVVDHRGLSRVSADGATTTPIPLPAGTLDCRPVRWWDVSQLLARCTDDLGPNPDDPSIRRTSSNMWLISMTGQAPTRLSSYVSEQVVDFGITNVWDVAGTRYAQWTGDCAAASFGTLDATGAYAARANGVAVLGHQAATFVAEKWASCGDTGSALALVDGRSGAIRSVLPRVGDAEGVRQAVVR